MRKIDFGMFRMFCIFVMSNITQWRGDLPIRAGIFIPVTLHIRQFCTSCWSVNILTAFYNSSEYSDGIKDSINLLPGG